jgi:alanine racemase
VEYERTYVKIDLDAIGNNTALARKKAAGAMIMAIVKADGYGHGAVELSRYLEDKVEYFGVSNVEEAVELRRAGIKNPILILGGVFPERYAELVLNDIMPSIYTLEAAENLSKAAASVGKIAKFHIAVDTGMSRIGFQTYEIADAVKAAKLKNVFAEGIFTHYATADETDKNFSKNQLKAFAGFLAELKKAGVEPPVKHISNSAGIIEFEGEHFDMVRMGIMTYGLYPSDEVDKNFGLKPALSFVTRISHIKTLPAGRGISYGLTYTTTAETLVATIPVGYADGYPRALSNKGKVLLHGKFAPILGRVCMDQTMIDVSGIPEAKFGDEVILVGEQRGKRITVEELAAPAASFNYEFVCGIGKRVTRLYYKDGKFFKRVSYI